MSHPATPSRFIGCDVGKTAIVVFDAASGRTRAVANTPEALSGFAASLEATCFVVCEATGGYERDLLAALIAAGVPACRADARKVKAFIRSFGTLGKSDAIDANALARYGRDRYAELPLWSAREPERERLQALVLARRHLVKDRFAYAISRRPRRRARPPLSRGAGRELRCANQRDRGRHQDLVRRVRADRQGRQCPGRHTRRRSKNRRRPHRPHARARFAPPPPGRRPRRPCAPSQSKRPDRRLSPNPRRKT